jgi:hypothetical protein
MTMVLLQHAASFPGQQFAVNQTSDSRPVSHCESRNLGILIEHAWNPSYPEVFFR